LRIENGELKKQPKNIVLTRSFDFAVRIVKLHSHLNNTYRIYSLSDQVLRSGTSIGANIVEAQDAQSDKDFVHKMSIALKEAKETQYWLKLLVASGYLDGEHSGTVSLLGQLEELLKLLSAIVKTSKEKCQ